MPQSPIDIDVQAKLDEWLAGNAAAQKYVSHIYYLPAGASIPDDVTHMNRLSSVRDETLALRLGVVALPETAALADVLLGMIAKDAGTAPPIPPGPVPPPDMGPKRSR